MLDTMEQGKVICLCAGAVLCVSYNKDGWEEMVIDKL